MTLLFEDRFGDYRVVAEVNNCKDAAAAITDFLNKYNYKSYYTRNWIREHDGFFRLMYDVGSHSEFFCIDFSTHEDAMQFILKE